MMDNMDNKGWNGGMDVNAEGRNDGGQNGADPNTGNGGWQNGADPNTGNNGWQNNAAPNMGNNAWQNGGYNQQYQNQNTGNMGGYQNASPYQGAPLMPDGYVNGPEEPISVGEWLITMLVLAIPCVNIIMLIVWGFGSTEKRSKSNFCKASLIWGAISVGLAIIFYIVVLAGVMSSMGW